MTDLDGKDYDSFFLQHLQAIHADSAWYQNQKFVGKGGNGTTFLVTCTSGANSGVQFALKVFHKISDQERRERFLAEIKHYRALSHPSIIDIHDEGTFSAGGHDYPFAVVDYVPTNLEAKLGRGLPQVSRFEIVRYILNVASGLCYLHGQNILHRDVKPANILVGDHSARLGDLGLAKTLMDDVDGEEGDVASYIAMPYFYRSPELIQRARGEGTELTVASDIYQLGSVLYRGLTGFNPQKRPVKSLDDIELDLRPIQGAAGFKLNPLIASMLDVQPENRPDASQVVRALSEVHKLLCEADFASTGVYR